MIDRCRRCSRALVAILVVVLTAAATRAEGPRPPINGMRPADLRTHAITDARVVISPGQVLERATIIIRKGLIEAVGEELPVPPDARVWPGEGLTIYPGLIDAAVLVPIDHNSDNAGAHWNDRIRSEINMLHQPVPPAELRSQLRELGFTVAAVYPSEGIFRGSGAVLSLSKDDQHVVAYTNRAPMAAGFDYGGRRGDTAYPASLMGAIALMRQTLYDAQWYQQVKDAYQADPQSTDPPRHADSLAALGQVISGNQPVFFDASDELNALRAAKVAREFDLDMILLGSGLEFRRLQPIVDLGVPIVVPVQYPQRPSVSTLELAARASLREMQTWEQAPTNARRLIEAGATIALSTHRLKTRSTFFSAVRSAITHGLHEDDALAALTTTPAQLLGIDHVTGTIEPGKVANLVVVNGGLFDEDAEIRDTWINGRRHEINAEPDITFAATGMLRTDTGIEVTIDIDTTKPQASLYLPNGKQARAKSITVQRDQVSLIIQARHLDASVTDGYARLSGVISGDMITGTGVMPDGSRFTFTIEPVGELPSSKADVVHDAPPADITGKWNMTVHIEGFDQPLPLVLTLQQHDDGSITGTSETMGMGLPISNANYDPATGRLTYQVAAPGGVVEITGTITGNHIEGTSGGAGMPSTFTGEREVPEDEEQDASTDESEKHADADSFQMPPQQLTFPLGAFALPQPPPQENVIVRHATIWTCGPDGIIEDGVLLAIDGKVAFIGSLDQWQQSNWPEQLPPVLTNIDASGKHITPGLIDCHSHTGIFGGINEWTHANTAEVRIADVINPDDINWYRQLAGGLTAANQLHGSANPIGGQNSVVKLKWGAATPDEMHINDAKAGIKFALGENVVRNQARYPNSRMGVKTILRDAFTSAQQYQLRRDDPARTTPLRRDLNLDALVDILSGDMLVHCHSYRQDEILMLIRVAEEFGFTIGTLQHVLEGYKVAESIAQHGAGASAFSDWWAYKMEVYDAIPFAGALMHHVGVNVSFNSDSSELARRMNTEAAKAVRYGGVSPQEALKFVTLNPARQLGIDHRVGSLEVGKDADFVIWSGDPLSTYTIAEQTWIEAARYFDRQQDRQLRQYVKTERHRLIQKILADQHGDPADAPDDSSADDTSDTPIRTAGPSRLMQRLLDNRINIMAEQYRLGYDPEEIRPGECGCNDWWYDLR